MENKDNLISKVCLHCGNECLMTQEFIENNSELFDKNDNFLCEECRDAYVICDDCGRFVHKDEYIYISDDERNVCENCLDNYNYCEYCEKYTSGETYKAYHNGNEIAICDYCANNYFTYCYDCDELFHDDNINEYDDHYYCDRCYEERTGCIGEYHDTARRGFVKQLLEGEDERTLTFGAEIEIDYGDNIKDTAKFFRDTIPCGTDRDGSLENGFEVITQPFSWNWLLEHQGDFKKAFQYAMDNNWKSHDTSTCGQHIHVQRPKDTKIIDRIAFIMETYKDELIKFSRRSNTDWCYFYSDTYINNEERIRNLKTLKGISKLVDYNKSEHSRALNLQHENTLEFRIFRGTLNFDTFMANIELVKNITELCSDLSLDVKDITWDKLTKGDYVRPYVESKEIFTNKVPRDLTNDIIKFENKMSKLCYRIINVVIEQTTHLYNTSFKKVLKDDVDYNTIIKFENLRNAIRSDKERIDAVIRYLKRGSYYDAICGMSYFDIYNISPSIKKKVDLLMKEYEKVSNEYKNFIDTH